MTQLEIFESSDFENSLKIKGISEDIRLFLERCSYYAILVSYEFNIRELFDSIEVSVRIKKRHSNWEFTFNLNYNNASVEVWDSLSGHLHVDLDMLGLRVFKRNNSKENKSLEICNKLNDLCEDVDLSVDDLELILENTIDKVKTLNKYHYSMDYNSMTNKWFLRNNSGIKYNMQSEDYDKCVDFYYSKLMNYQNQRNLNKGE